MFYRKVKKFCFVVNFFIWIIIKNYWYDVKSVKKLECFLFDFFGRSEMKIKNLAMGCQTGPWLLFLYSLYQPNFFYK
jgi:hypothetical protein